MSSYQKKFQQESAHPDAQPEPEQRIRLTLHSTDLKAIERVCTDFVRAAQTKKFKTCGPVRLPVRKLRITTRKTPCGQGSKTWDKFELRMYKRIIDIFGTSAQLNSISNLAPVEHNVDVEVVLCE
ncbi:40S ribosomal protein S20 [Gregarina niphandrodes]|uniref:40S ribosomal protein S20 n=1 Tax=Gregarina niphandrodes TaxID=110365 RepID=A0A023B1Y6_GRENI|nr:40S ribosomal protein S20 [Gregarina niphandrodes]EZG48579.1 40S ribosomal protein S20 [Gregarina niphandrodes]|eukprot:XP_011132083.1 40S ribosomal protein S20 [Gregarina niphandrodes]